MNGTLGTYSETLQGSDGSHLIKITGIHTTTWGGNVTTTATPTWDGDGNMTNDGQEDVFTYDGINELTQVLMADGTSAAIYLGGVGLILGRGVSGCLVFCCVGVVGAGYCGGGVGEPRARAVARVEGGAEGYG